MRILITGAAGFIGSHLTEELRAHGHDVVPVDRTDGDLRYAGVAAALLDEHEPQLVVHLAAKVGRLFGEDDPAETIADNAGMTAYVARACGERGIRLAYASTSEIYGDRGHTNFPLCHEGKVPNGHGLTDWSILNYAWTPHNIYGLSKRWGEEVCELYAPDNLAILRLSMPYGPGHVPGRGRAALTNFLWNAKRREPIPVHRGSERSWCWIGDTVRGIRLVIERSDGGVYNVGRDDNAVSMRTVAEMACDLVGAPHALIEEVDPPERQTVVKRLSTAKLEALGWKPEVELHEGMQRTLDWLKGQGTTAPARTGISRSALPRPSSVPGP